MDDLDLIQENMQSLRFWAATLSVHLPPVIDFDDLFMAGVTGLLRAKDKHDPQKSSRRTYFSHKVRGAVMDEIRELRDGSRKYQEFELLVHKTGKDLSQELGRKPSLYEISQRLGMEESYVYKRILCLPVEMLRFDQNFPVEKIPDDAPLPGENIALEELKKMLQNLPERERYILEQYYFENRHMVDIGSELGVTESRICQIHKEALERLRVLYTDSGIS